MCGIVGTLFRTPGKGIEMVRRSGLTGEMLASIAHRGPDGQDFLADSFCSLGIALLSFFGRRNHRLLTNEDGSVWLACNGEVYNYASLKQQIKNRHSFKSDCDSEVIVHLYEELRDKVVSRIDGQFAFLIWDRVRRRLIAARDRFGICPLHYHISPDRILFASEIKALFADVAVPRKLVPDALFESIIFYAPIPPRTCFEEVCQLPSGHLLTIDLSSWRTTLTRYWNPSGSSVSQALPQKGLAKEFKLLFLKTVHECAEHGNNPPGLLISGGIDSSLMAALAAKHAGIHNAYSVVFREPDFDERKYQRILSNHCALEHKKIECTEDMIVDGMARVVWHTECPLFRSAPIPLFLLARFIREAGERCLLSAQGADELFCGYPIFRTVVLHAQLLSNALKRGKSRLRVQLGREQLPAHFRTWAKTVRDDNRIARYFPGHYAKWEMMLGIHNVFDRQMGLSLDAGRLERLLGLLGNQNFIGLDVLTRAQIVEMETKQAGYLLAAQGDRVFLGNGVEVRYPYLRNEVLDFALSVSSEFRMSPRLEKTVLRDATLNLLPAKLRNRPKQGYLAPGRLLFVPGSCDLVEQLLSRRSIHETGIFEYKAISSLRNKARNAATFDRVTEASLWLALSTQLLHGLFIVRSVKNQ